MFFPGTSLRPTPYPSLREAPHMLTLFLFAWLISFPWKADKVHQNEPPGS